MSILPQKASTRVALNTGILYAKMLITTGITLYSTRLVLNALGDSDYGIFNLVAGVIAMLSFLNVAMTVSTQRYLSFHQGTGDIKMQNKIFVNSWFLHISLSVIIVSIILLLSPFLFNGFLNIPEEKVSTANKLYNLMSISVFFTIISVPFTASLNAHENMLWIAIVNIIESILKLSFAFALLWFIQSQRLIIYGYLMASLSFITFILYAIYCLKKYEECSIRVYRIDKLLIKELTGFAGWNLFGALCTFSRSQGLAVILNIFLGTIVNAAYGIANQTASQLSFFSQTMLRAINPQIMKSAGMTDQQRMLRLSMIASKSGFFLLAFIAIPVIFEMPAILELWLKNVPQYTSTFCSLALIAILTNQLTVGLQSAIQATGRIKMYQLCVGGIQFLNLPAAYILLKHNFPPYFVFIASITVEALSCILRLYFLKKETNMSIFEYTQRVFAKEVSPVILSLMTCYIIVSNFSFEYRFLLTISISTGVFLLSVYFLGLCEDEKKLIDNIFKNIINRIKKQLNK